MKELMRKGIMHIPPTMAVCNLVNVLILKLIVLNKNYGKLKINRFKIPNYA